MNTILIHFSLKSNTLLIKFRKFLDKFYFFDFHNESLLFFSILKNLAVHHAPALRYS